MIHITKARATLTIGDKTEVIELEVKYITLEEYEEWYKQAKGIS